MAEEIKKEEYTALIESPHCLFATVRGSHVFGLNGEGSDFDMDGVFFNPASMYDPNKYIPCLETETKDDRLVSIDRFLDFLEEGDTDTVEMIHIPRKWWKKSPDPIMKWIFDNKKSFITKNFFIKAAEFAKAQVRRELVKGDPAKKNKLASHALRIINMCVECIELSNAAGYVVPLILERAGSEAKEILRIKYQTPENQLSGEEMKAIIEIKLNKFESLLRDSDVMSVFPNTLEKSVREHLLNIVFFEKAKFQFNSVIEERLNTPIIEKAPEWLGVKVDFLNFEPGKTLHVAPLGTCEGYDSPAKPTDNLEVWLETNGLKEGENYNYHFPHANTKTFIEKMKEDYDTLIRIGGKYEFDLKKAECLKNPEKFLKKEYQEK